MQLFRRAVVLLALVVLTPAARAGLYYSGEQLAELPSQWRGFLIDQRLLRNLALKPTSSVSASPLRLRYQEAAAQLEKAARERRLSADEQADLGALYVRLGLVPRAVEVLRAAQKDHSRHFRIAANLGTAWQMHGDLEHAAACLQEAVVLAPGKWQKAEEYHLRLVRLRQRGPRDTRDLDDLFSISFVNDRGAYEPGILGADQRKKLPTEAVAIVQQLALWLPADGQLLWLLAELAGAHGDVQTAAAIMDGCVTEFAMRSPDLRSHRQRMRAAADELTKKPGPGSKVLHQGHAAGLKMRSSRPLVDKLDLVDLPPIKIDGVNVLPWSVVTKTTVDRHYRPTFPDYLQELEGKQVTLSGYMQPLGDDLEGNAFLLIEYPVGCWYCEMPDVVAIVLVELPPGETHALSREMVQVTGKLTLNKTDPENFLYTIGQATVSQGE